MQNNNIPTLPPRKNTAHKGDFGLCCLVGGSRGMSGAIALAAMAAVHTGAGLVRLLVPGCILETVACLAPEFMTVPLPCDRNGKISLSAWDKMHPHLEKADVLAFGPGFGQSLGITALFRRLISGLPKKSIVFDADALNAISSFPEIPKMPGCILTPHLAEFARLLKKPVPENRVEAAMEFADRTQTIIVLKGHRSVVTNGKEFFENPSGNPGMAKGGSGDVLTGVIAALIAQKMPPFEAAKLGVYIHGLAGDAAAEKYGQESVTASRMIELLFKTT